MKNRYWYMLYENTYGLWGYKLFCNGKKVFKILPRRSHGEALRRAKRAKKRAIEREGT